MKNLLIGGIGVLLSVLLFGMVLIPAAVSSPVLPNSRNKSVFGTALSNIDTIPLLIGVALFFLGVYFVLKGIKKIFFSDVSR